MKIVQIVGRFDPEHTAHCGITDYTGHLAAALARAGHRIRVVPRPADAHGWGARRVAGLVRLIREWAPDVVHLQYQPDMFDRSPMVGVYPRLLRAGSTRPVFVTTLHSLWHRSLLSPTRLYAHLLLRASDAIVVTNPMHYDQAWRARPGLKDRIAMIPVAANIPVIRLAPERRAQLRAEWGVEPAGLVLANFGFPREDKGLHDAIDALARVRAQGVPAIFIHFGEVRPVDEACVSGARRLADELGQTPNIRWLGSLSDEAVSACLQAADVYVAPYTDGFSTRRTSALVALTHALPLVTTFNEYGQRSELEHAVALVPARDPNALSQVLLELARDSEKRQRLAEAGRRLSAHFDQSVLAGRHMEVYETAIARARGVSRR